MPRSAARASSATYRLRSATRARRSASIGPNGAGKTTLVRAIAALIPHEGTIDLDGQAVATMEPRVRARAIAYLAQGAGSHWPLEVSRLVALGRLPHLAPFRAPTGTRSRRRPCPRRAACGYRELSVGRDVLTLSGGERARVLLARVAGRRGAVARLVDEPVASARSPSPDRHHGSGCALTRARAAR